MTGRLEGREVPIRDRDQLLEAFHQACHPAAERRVGLEYERVGVTAEGTALPFSGPAGVEAVLRRLAAEEGCRGLLEEGRMIEVLLADGARVTLEPGGQMELAGLPMRTLGEIRAQLRRFQERVDRISRELGVTWLGMGTQPRSPLAEIEWVPKRRYRIMSAYLGARGEQAHRMMKQTAAIQVSFDFTDEEDFQHLFRTATGLSAVVNAWVAHAPLLDGEDTGLQSCRPGIWAATDPERCGLLQPVFEGGGFAAFLDYALSAPTMFVVEGGELVETGRLPFRRLLEEGFRGHAATEADWELHLSALFPEVRVKRYVEIRGADGNPPEVALAVAAFWKGVLYHRPSREAAWGLVADLSWAERLALAEAVGRSGLSARLGDRPLVEVAGALLPLAEEGLRAQGEPVSELDPLRRILERGAPPAVELAARWEEGWRENPAALVAHYQACNRLSDPA